MLVIWLISDKECRLPSIKPKALLLRFGVHSTVFMTYLINYNEIGSLFKMVVVLASFVIIVVSGGFVIVEISVNTFRRSL